jgi:DNA-binding Lrp family transcriptional regulator
MKAYVLMTVKPGTSKDVVKVIREIKEVAGVDSVWGRYDVIAIIEAPNLEKISEIIYKVVEKHPNIVHTETAITLWGERLPVRAFVLVVTKPGTSEEIVGARRVRGVKLANSVFGRFDAVVVVEGDDLEQLRKNIYDVLEKMPGIIHTETLLALPI